MYTLLISHLKNPHRPHRRPWGISNSLILQRPQCPPTSWGRGRSLEVLVNIFLCMNMSVCLAPVRAFWRVSVLSRRYIRNYDEEQWTTEQQLQQLHVEVLRLKLKCIEVVVDSFCPWGSSGWPERDLRRIGGARISKNKRTYWSGGSRATCHVCCMDVKCSVDSLGGNKCCCWW